MSINYVLSSETCNCEQTTSIDRSIDQLDYTLASRRKIKPITSCGRQQVRSSREFPLSHLLITERVRRSTTTYNIDIQNVGKKYLLILDSDTISCCCCWLEEMKTLNSGILSSECFICAELAFHEKLTQQSLRICQLIFG